jgi:predicted nucleotide-binding protein
VARTLQQLTGTEPTILHEMPDGGRTGIEKFEHHAAAAGAAVVILSPDDVGGLDGDDPQLQAQARQNVVFELG